MSNKVNVVFPDNTKRELSEELTAYEIAKDISEGLARAVIGATYNGKLVDLTTPLEKADSDTVNLKLLKKDDEEAKGIYRHTLAHVMAQAVTRLFGPDRVVLGIGPTIENGFYYDIEVKDGQITEEDLPKIEKEMKKIIKANYPISRFELPRDEAIKMMEESGQNYKVELIKDLPENEAISFYKQDDFVDLCRGPHLPSTGKIKSFKLLSLAGAYWRGDEHNPMLQRIYATAFANNEALEQYLTFIEEAKKRDHRKLGPQLDLFIMNDAAAGMPFFLPKGTTSLLQLMEMWRKFHKTAGYVEVMTPLIMHQDLWKQSGHWDHYRENMYFIEKDEQHYAVKPMNCPGHIIMYKNDAISYRQLPWRMAEFGKVHRYEMSGVLHGLFRVRSFTQDDAHLFITPEQIVPELIGVVQLVDKMYKLFGFEYEVELSTRPENSMGSKEQWDTATEGLKEALKATGTQYRINEGDGAFYGPKIDFHIKDSLGRTWQCATCQLDFQMPERFDMTYIAADNEEHRPTMIHRTILGSLERFFGILIEHFAGALPTWIAPTQVMVLPIADRHIPEVQKLKERLEASGLRVEMDGRSKKVNYKIREAQLKKIPYMIIMGDNEIESGKISLRLRSEKEIKDMDVNLFIEKVKQEICDYSLKSPFEQE